MRRLPALLLLALAMSLPAEAGPVARDAIVDGLAATFVRPARAPFPAVVVIAGSGPTDRDGNNPLGVKASSYRLLAEALAAEGVASVRYDKRGVAESAAPGLREADVTLETFAEDARRVAAWLAGQEGVASVSLVGHSEGGVLAFMAGRGGTAPLVLLCAPGRPLGAILREQMAKPAIPEDLRTRTEEILHVLEAGGGVTEVDPRLAALFRPSVQPFLRSALAVDPAALARAHAGRLMVVGGGRDVQVGRVDFDVVMAARPDATPLWDARMAHTLKRVGDEADAPARAYADPTLPLAPGLAAAIAAFVKAAP